GFDSDPGLGVWATVKGWQVLVGNRRLMERHKVAVDELVKLAEGERSEGATAIYVAIGGSPAGLLVIADAVKQTTEAAIEAVRRAGIRIIMLTGDDEGTAQAVARKLGVDEVIADVLPQDKAAVVKRLQDEGEVVAMAGDGVNDAPA